MERVRVHNFSVSLDGFGTGDGQSLDAPFGHAGNRLHEWFFPTIENRYFVAARRTYLEWAAAAGA